jgi:hypothetical protein
MRMKIDQPRSDQLPADVDDTRSLARRESGADLRDESVLDTDVGQPPGPVTRIQQLPAAQQQLGHTYQATNRIAVIA